MFSIQGFETAKQLISVTVGSAESRKRNSAAVVFDQIEGLHTHDFSLRLLLSRSHYWHHAVLSFFLNSPVKWFR